MINVTPILPNINTPVLDGVVSNGVVNNVPVGEEFSHVLANAQVGSALQPQSVVSQLLNPVLQNQTNQTQNVDVNFEQSLPQANVALLSAGLDQNPHLNENQQAVSHNGVQPKLNVEQNVKNNPTQPLQNAIKNSNDAIISTVTDTLKYMGEMPEQKIKSTPQIQIPALNQVPVLNNEFVKTTANVSLPSQTQIKSTNPIGLQNPLSLENVKITENTETSKLTIQPNTKTTQKSIIVNSPEVAKTLSVNVGQTEIIPDDIVNPITKTVISAEMNPPKTVKTETPVAVQSEPVQTTVKQPTQTVGLPETNPPKVVKTETPVSEENTVTQQTVPIVEVENLNSTSIKISNDIITQPENVPAKALKQQASDVVTAENQNSTVVKTIAHDLPAKTAPQQKQAIITSEVVNPKIKIEEEVSVQFEKLPANLNQTVVDINQYTEKDNYVPPLTVQTQSPFLEKKGIDTSNANKDKPNVLDTKESSTEKQKIIIDENVSPVLNVSDIAIQTEPKLNDTITTFKMTETQPQVIQNVVANNVEIQNSAEKPKTFDNKELNSDSAAVVQNSAFNANLTVPYVNVEKQVTQNTGEQKDTTISNEINSKNTTNVFSVLDGHKNSQSNTSNSDNADKSLTNKNDGIKNSVPDLKTTETIKTFSSILENETQPKQPLTERPTSASIPVDLPNSLSSANTVNSRVETTPKVVEISPMVNSFGASEWGDELGQKIVWMTNQGVSSAEIKMNPQNLGAITVRIDMNQEQQASISFAAQNVGVRDALEASIPKLRDMMASQQVNLVDVNVSANSSFNQQQQAQNPFTQMDNSTNNTNAQSQNNRGLKNEADVTETLLDNPNSHIVLDNGTNGTSSWFA